jgi:DNA (cytosine-5)-methyltransferase 1
MGTGNRGGHATVAVAIRDTSPTITSNYGKQIDSSDTALGPNVVFPNMAVRRLTPRECERLQGFPDDYTLLGEKTPDGPRYKALGNSMAVPVMRWIGERINKELAP